MNTPHSLSKELRPIAKAVEEVADVDQVHGVGSEKPFVFCVVDFNDEVWRDPGGLNGAFAISFLFKTWKCSQAGGVTLSLLLLLLRRGMCRPHVTVSFLHQNGLLTILTHLDCPNFFSVTLVSDYQIVVGVSNPCLFLYRLYFADLA